MRAPLAVPLVLALLLALGLAGCIEGRVFPAEIPAANLASGWSYSASNSFDGVAGQEPFVRAHYRVNVYAQGPEAVALVISMPDVPLVDVQGIVTEQLDKFLLDRGITTTFHSSGTGEVGGQPVEYTVSTANRQGVGGSAQGFAIDVPYRCAANGQHVRIFGFAATTTTLLGRPITDRATWEELAGRADQGTLGGMVRHVRCS